MDKMDISKFVGDERPNVEEIEGMELFYNEMINRWCYRPNIGYSDKFVSLKNLVPQNDKNNVKKKRNIDSAKSNKDDEFYTRFDDISAELHHYKEFFKDKIVYCPCDKAFNKGRSEFVNYFIKVFKFWGIKELIYTQYNPNGRGYFWTINLGNINDGELMDEHDIDTYLLDGNGDFCSQECIDIMKKCDIVVTNPPFSLFRKFVAQLMELNKHFLIIGNKNAITYKEIYPLIKDNKIWLGYTSPSGFIQPDWSEEIKNLSGLTRWFTNLPHKKRLNDKIPIWKTYSPDKYFTYDNYEEAIECGHFKAEDNEKIKGNWVGSVDDIPVYDGIMGVPITFLDVYNPNQFEIIGFRKGKDGKDLTFHGYSPYFRILIKAKKDS